MRTGSSRRHRGGGRRGGPGFGPRGCLWGLRPEGARGTPRRLLSCQALGPRALKSEKERKHVKETPIFFKSNSKPRRTRRPREPCFLTTSGTWGGALAPRVLLGRTTELAHPADAGLGAADCGPDPHLLLSASHLPVRPQGRLLPGDMQMGARPRCGSLLKFFKSLLPRGPAHQRCRKNPVALAANFEWLLPGGTPPGAGCGCRL